MEHPSKDSWQIIHTIVYKSCIADTDLWYKLTSRLYDGFEYYAYVLLYVDDCLCIHQDS